MFEKKTWEDRITENPGRRKLTNTETGEETTVDVERAEGNVSRVGTSFSSILNLLSTLIAIVLNFCFAIT